MYIHFNRVPKNGGSYTVAPDSQIRAEVIYDSPTLPPWLFIELIKEVINKRKKADIWFGKIEYKSAYSIFHFAYRHCFFQNVTMKAKYT